jgi:hypothetical protein
VALLAPGETVAVGNPRYPVEVTRNGGRTWSYVALPVMPGVTAAAYNLPAPRLLPNGVLLAQDPANARYYELNRGSSAWTRVPNSLALLGNTTMSVVGNMVYWQSFSANSPGGTAKPLPPARFLAVPVARY